MHLYVQIKIEIFQVFFLNTDVKKKIDAGIRETQSTRGCMRTRAKI